MSSTLNGIGTVELLESADPAAADAVRKRGRKPVVEINPGEPSVKNGIQGVILSDETGGVGSVVRLDSGDPAEAEAARKRGQVPLIVVDETGEPVASGGGGGQLTVPEDAVAFGGFSADNLGSWTEAGGDADLTAFVGNDPDVDSGLFTTSGYNPAELTADGLVSAGILAFLGDAKTRVLAGSTIVFHLITDFADAMEPIFGVVSDNGDDKVACNMAAGPGAQNVYINSYNGSVSVDTVDGMVDGENKIAVTLTPTRAEVSVNGGAVASDTMDSSDWPTTGDHPISAAFFDVNGTLVSIAMYEPVAIGDLPALSALPPPEWLPEGAVAYADFINEHYYAGGEQVAVTEMFGTDAESGAAFDDALIGVDGYGSELNTSKGALLDDTLAALVGGATVVAEFEQRGGGSSFGMFFEVFGLPDWFTNYVFNANTTSCRIRDFDAIDVTLDPIPGDAVSRMAFTMIPGAKLAMSVNGAAVSSHANPNLVEPASNAYFQASASSYVRTIAIYPPQDDADLPALSALPPPEWLPEGAVSHFDFINEQYYAEGAERVAGDLNASYLGADVNTDSGWGTTGFDPDSVEADGYIYTVSGFSRPPALLGTALTSAVASGVTVAVTFKTLTAAPDGPHIVIGDTEGDNAIQLRLDHKTSLDAELTSWSGPLAVTGADVVDGTNGAINRVAYTITPTAAAFSVNGAAISTGVVDATDWPVTGMHYVVFDSAQLNYIRSITVYPPQDDADLPALSTL